MIEVYLTLLENEDSGKVIEFNDAFFDDNLSKIEFDSDKIKLLISTIDQGEYIGEFKFLSKIGHVPISVTELSTGCKTAINVVTFPDMIVSLAECGINAIEEIFKLSNGRVFIESPTYLPYTENRNVAVFKDENKEIVSLEDLNRLFLGEKYD